MPCGFNTNGAISKYVDSLQIQFELNFFFKLKFYLIKENDELGTQSKDKNCYLS